jgi:hypothetical protein
MRAWNVIIIVSVGNLIFGLLLGTRLRVAILPPAGSAVGATLLFFKILNRQVFRKLSLRRYHGLALHISP